MRSRCRWCFLKARALGADWGLPLAYRCLPVLWIFSGLRGLRPAPDLEQPPSCPLCRVRRCAWCASPPRQSSSDHGSRTALPDRHQPFFGAQACLVWTTAGAAWNPGCRFRFRWTSSLSSPSQRGLGRIILGGLSAHCVHTRVAWFPKEAVSMKPPRRLVYPADPHSLTAHDQP